MEYRSEIRDSQINDLLDKVSRGNYGQYLSSINIIKARAINEQAVFLTFLSLPWSALMEEVKVQYLELLP